MSLSIQYAHLMAGDPRLRKASDLPVSQAESWDLNLACVGPLHETGAPTQKRWSNSYPTDLYSLQAGGSSR